MLRRMVPPRPYSPRRMLPHPSLTELPAATPPLVEVTDLRVRLPTARGPADAVRGV